MRFVKQILLYQKWYRHNATIISTKQPKGSKKMKNVKYAVAILKGEDETILGVFSTEKEADSFADKNKLSHEAGLHYCFSSRFSGRKPIGNSICIRSYYNA